MTFFAPILLYLDFGTAADRLSFDVSNKNASYTIAAAAIASSTKTTNTFAKSTPVDEKLTASDGDISVKFGAIPSAESIRIRNLFNFGFADVAVAEARVYLTIEPSDTDVRQLLINFYTKQQQDTLASTQTSLVNLWHIYLQKDYSKAIIYAENLLKQMPSNIDIQFALGQFYLVEKDYLHAKPALMAVLASNPRYVAASVALIDLYVATHDIVQAQQVLTQGLALSAQNTKLLAKKTLINNQDNRVDDGHLRLTRSELTLEKFNLIWQLWHHAQYDQAIAQAQDYLKIHPDAGQIALSLAQFYQNQNKYQDAIKTIDQILAKNPTYVEARVSLSDIYIAAHDYQTAEKVINQGLVYMPFNKDLLAQKQSIVSLHVFDDIWQLWHQHQQAQAIAKAKNYLIYHPQSLQISLSLGQFYLLNHDLTQALEQINPILATTPQYTAARITLIDIYLAMKAMDKATAVLEQGLKLSPNDLSLLEEKKVVADANSATQSTTMPLATSVKKDDGLVTFNHLWQCWKDKKQTQAITEAKAYLQKNPGEDSIKLSLAQFYFLQKKYSLAIAEINQILAKNPGYVAARTTLIDIYIATKDYAKAMATLNQGLAISPNNLALQQERKAINLAQVTKLKTKVPKEQLNDKTIVPKPAAITPANLSYVETGALNARLTSGYGYWFNQYLKTVLQTDANNLWEFDALHGFEFNQKADYGIIQQTHLFSDRWYAALGAGISDNSIWVPKYYIGGTINRKLLASKKLVAYLGFQSYWFRPVYKLETLNPGFIYYFDEPWVIEAGGYLNRSNPGHVDTAIGYFAVTQGQLQNHLVTLRVAYGREGYLPLNHGASIVGYPSLAITATWRQWLGKYWGYSIAGEDYHNTFYNRYNGSFGLFKEFSI